MKRIFSVLSLVIISILIFSNCSTLPQKQNTTNIPYSIRSMMSLVVDRETIKNELPNIISTVDNVDLNYTVFTLANKSYIFVFYREGDVVEFLWQLNTLFDKKDFVSLQKGSNEEDVRKIDPFTTIWGDNDGTSEHRCIDGTLITISYVQQNGKWIIDKIDYSADDFHFIDRISKADLETLTK